jgi:hypothetical protein
MTNNPEELAERASHYNNPHLWSKTCPKCGHSALEHKEGNPRNIGNDGFYLRSYHEKLYCWEPVPAAENKDYDTYCDCEIAEGDYWKVRNGARIRATAVK